MKTESARESIREPSARSLSSLDYLSMCIGDVIGGIGPYLAAYLRAVRHWDQAGIGAALSAFSLATILAQTPAGALIDRCRQKRLVLGLATLMMSLSVVALTMFAQFPAVVTAQVMYGIGVAIAGSCLVALSLGIVGHQRFASALPAMKLSTTLAM